MGPEIAGERKEGDKVYNRNELLANNQFLVTFGPLSFSFSKVSNIQDSLEYESISEGGVNGHPIILRKNKSKTETVLFEQGIQTGAGGLGMTMLTTGVPVYVVTIMVMRNKRISKIYCFEEGLITRWEVGSLDAMSKEIFIKKVEITHTGLHEMPVP